MKSTFCIFNILAGGLLLMISCSEEAGVTLPSVSMPEEGSITPVAVTCSQALDGYTHTFTLHSDQAPSTPLMGSITVDESYVTAYNAEHGTAYQMMPDNIYEIPAADFIIAQGRTESNTVNINFLGTVYGLEKGVSYLLPIVPVIDENVIGDCTTGIPVHYIAMDVDREYIYTPGLRFSSSSSTMRQTLSFADAESAVDMGDNTHTFEMRIFPYSWHSGVNYIGTWRGYDRNNNNEGFSGCEIRVTYNAGEGLSNIGNRQCDLTLARTGDKPITTGEWHTITVTCDGSKTGQSSEPAYRLYYDGELISEAAPTKRYGQASSQGFKVGYSLNGFTFGNSASNYFDGLIGEIRIWKDCLSQEQIKASLRTVVNPSADKMYAYWKLDEGDGVLLKDSSGNGRDLSFTEGTDVTWSAELEAGE